MSFKCQRCKQPLRLDDSLTNMDQASVDMLIAPLSSEEEYEKETQKKNTLKNKALLPQPLNSRLIGIKQPNLTPSPTRSKYTNDSFPASSESFVVLPRPDVNLSTNPTSNLQIMTNPTLKINDMKTQSNSDPTAVQEQNWTRNNTLSHRLKVANRVFDIMSSKSNVDHPMCQECTDMLLELLENQMSDVSRERDGYIEFLKKVKDSRVTKEEEQELTKQVQDLKLAEEEAAAELLKLQEQEQELDKELEALSREMEALEKQEQDFWDNSIEYQINLQNFQNDRDSINLKYDHDVKQYEKLQKTVVYNDAFCISHDGPFGTINGYRLGKLSTHQVEWNEINAAWGQTLLLLYTVANKLKFQFKTYRLVPMGSFSKIEKVDGDSVVSYELYGSSDFGINRMLFINRRFDHAMAAVLNCLKQLTDYAEVQDKSLRLPYRINKDKIGELSIRLQFNQEELWTKALKYMLTNMKWILVFASRASVSNDTVRITSTSSNENVTT